MILNKELDLVSSLFWILYEMCEFGEHAEWFFGSFCFFKEIIFTL